MTPKPTASRPKTGHGNDHHKRTAADGRQENTGDPETLSSRIVAAREAAPTGADTIQICSVAWTAHQRDVDPADVWLEVIDARAGQLRGGKADG